MKDSQVLQPNKNHRNNIIMHMNIGLFIFFFLLGLFGGLLVWNAFVRVQLDALKIVANPYPSFSPAAYPEMNLKNFPDVSAQGIIVMDSDSHTVMYMKNPDVRFSPASTTKIMTAYVGLQYYDLENILTSWDAIDTEGDGLGLISGQRMRFGDLLYASLIASANDAAHTIATNYPGGVPAFLKRMNETAWSLHMYNTHYTDANGLDDDGDFTTPRDLLTIASVAMKDPIFRRIVATASTTISDFDKTRIYQLKSTNKLLGIDGVNGIKTGTTQEAGQVLVTSSTKQNHTVYLVLMRSGDRFADTKALLEFIWGNLHYRYMYPVLH